MKYKVIRVRYGEHQKYLNEDYEPFGVTSDNTSYNFMNTSTGKRETEYRITDYIYLRKQGD
jgi:hypothetical protein